MSQPGIPEPSLAVRLLGSAAIEQAGRPLAQRAAHRHGLALLAMLASARGRLVNRDRVLALLWPDGDAETLRHRLNVLLYDLRRILGRDAIQSINDDLRLDPERVWVDVCHFLAAVERDDFATAIALYRGPFLDAFYLPDAPEFDQWAGVERERLAKEVARACEGYAAAAERSGNAREAVVRWRRLAQLDPLGSRPVLGLMRTLAALGEFADAIKTAEQHAARRAQQIGAPPDPTVQEMAEQLRAASVRGSPVRFTEVARGPLSLPEHPPFRSRRRILWAAVAGAVVLLAAVALAVSRIPAGSDAPEVGRVAVLPFGVRGDPEFRYLAEGMVDLLATNLDGAGSLVAVDPAAMLAYLGRVPDLARTDPSKAVAREFRAGFVLRGTVFATAQEMRVSAVLSRSGGQETSRATVRGHPDNILRLVDDLTAQLLVGAFPTPRQRMHQLAGKTTASLPALKAWLSGEADFRAGRFVQAAEAFGQAAAADTSFGLANYRFALATLWSDQWGASAELADRRAVRDLGRLGAHDRALVQAYAASRRGDGETAERLYRRIVAEHPDDIEAWHELGESLFHYGPMRGRPLSNAREPFERAASYDPRLWGALWHLALIAASEERWNDFEGLADRLLALHPDPRRELEVRAVRILARETEGRLNTLLAELRDAESLRLFDLAWRTAVFGHRPDRALQVVELLKQPGRAEADRRLGTIVGAHLHWALGHRTAALAQLDSLAHTEAAPNTAAIHADWTTHPFEFVVQAAAAGLPPRPATELAALRAKVYSVMLGSGIGSRGGKGRFRRAVGEYLDGLLAGALRDSAILVIRAQSLAAAASPRDATPASFAHSLRARQAQLAGRPELALARLDSARIQQWYGLLASDPLLSQPVERFERAELLASLGRHREALGWLASFGEHSVYDVAYLPEALLRQAELHAHLGERAAASGRYQRFLALWERCDPELTPLVVEVKRRLQELH
ncbi:MAG: BTAD domain-containing putative transcriptional regulator [Gemmatimonadales bacterium]